jgi:hypothetical protein
MTTRIIGFLLALAGGSLATSGCVMRTIKDFDDHQKNSISTLQVLQITHYGFFATAEHQFFMCEDSGNTLTCKRECGGTNELQCPAGAFVGLAGASNVR